MKRLFVALLVTVAIASGFFAGRASAAQPFMTSALEHLHAARADLGHAVADKGGHREAAIRLVDSAIAEVERGIAYARH